MAMTPRLRSSAVSDNSLLSAPRSLNEAVNCRFSNLSQISQPAISDKVRDSRVGVRSTCAFDRLCRGANVVDGDRLLRHANSVAEDW